MWLAVTILNDAVLDTVSLYPLHILILFWEGVHWSPSSFDMDSSCSSMLFDLVLL